MSAPILICLGLQRAFTDLASTSFSGTAAVRRPVCEQILRMARMSGWTVIHSLLCDDSMDERGMATIEGFAPLASEAYFKQRTLSAFRTPGFEARIRSLGDGPVYLIGFGGLSAIGATFFDALELGIPLHIVDDAVAHGGEDCGRELEALSALTTLARAHGRHTSLPQLPGYRGFDARGAAAWRERPVKPSASGVQPSSTEIVDLAAVGSMVHFIRGEIANLLPNPERVAHLLDEVSDELDADLDNAKRTSGADAPDQ